MNFIAALETATETGFDFCSKLEEKSRSFNHSENILGTSKDR
jgi:hypothetical protein